MPVHLHPYYRDRFGTEPGDCPVAEAAYERLLSLPMFPAMSDGDVRGRDRGGGESPGRLSVGVPPLGGFSDDPGWSPAFRRLFGRSG